MADRKQKVQLPGSNAIVDAVEVTVDEATERWTDIQLADGSHIRIKTVVLEVLRLEGQYDGDGKPLYQLKASQIMTVTSPEHLQKGAGGTTAH